MSQPMYADKGPTCFPQRPAKYTAYNIWPDGKAWDPHEVYCGPTTERWMDTAEAEIARLTALCERLTSESVSDFNSHEDHLQEFTVRAEAAEARIAELEDQLAAVRKCATCGHREHSGGCIDEPQCLCIQFPELRIAAKENTRWQS